MILVDFMIVFPCNGKIASEGCGLQLSALRLPRCVREAVTAQPVPICSLPFMIRAGETQVNRLCRHFAAARADTSIEGISTAQQICLMESAGRR